MASRKDDGMTPADEPQNETAASGASDLKTAWDNAKEPEGTFRASISGHVLNDQTLGIELTILGGDNDGVKVTRFFNTTTATGVAIARRTLQKLVGHEIPFEQLETELKALEGTITNIRAFTNKNGYYTIEMI